MKVRLWILVAVIIKSAYCQSSETPSQNPCNGRRTCHECIQTSTCAWCSDPDYGFGTKSRCFHPGSADNSCRPQFVYNPSNDYIIIKNRQLSKGSKTSSSSIHEESSISGSSSSSSSSSSSGSMSSSHYHHDAVQIEPQSVKLKLRINEKYKIKIKYAQAEDYPVDLYYLMDLSKSMEDDKDKLSVLGNLLAEQMQKITSNFRLGFGSFVDKVVMPYVSVVPKNLAEPCSGCKAPYGFQNVMSLSTNTSRFAEEVKNAHVSGNLDAPEGGFDAIMQAVVCRNQIGWRQKARRLLVFSTDAGFHYAGDGKLGGIVKPNDGYCHLDSRGHYTHSTIQDYPSISQINMRVKENAINLIFAVTEEQMTIYKKLHKHIEGSSAGQLSDDSANVVELVKEQYGKITSSVELKDNSSSNVKVTYFSNCLNTKGDLIETSKCDGLKVGTVVNFQAQIEWNNNSCPLNKKDRKGTFQIYPVGINETLTVELEMICDCPCEYEGDIGYKKEAEECNGFTYQCGICDCGKSHFGSKCECDENSVQKHDGAVCKPDNTTTSVCSGRGQCVCGLCVCDVRSDDEKIEGEFCECDNFSCDRENGQLCSGKDHGTCKCGKCDCEPGWSGTSCSCKESIDSCIPPGGGMVCSGKGKCECGVCKCNTEEGGLYSGRFCEKCPTCPGRCKELRDCVQCQVYKSGPLSEEECAANCTSFVPVILDVIEGAVDESKNENKCQYYDNEDCRYIFVYGYDEKGKLVVKAQREKDCPPQVYVLGIVFGVIGAIVLIGLAILLLWKLLTTIHDRREFAKFEKERKLARWDTGENPIYKQATSTFKNPTYAGK